VLSEKYFILNLANTSLQSRQYISLYDTWLHISTEYISFDYSDRSLEKAPGFPDPATVGKLLVALFLKCVLFAL
jgi:hypothetical protein